MKNEVHNHNGEPPYQRIVIRDCLELNVIRETELVSTGTDSKEALENMKELIKLAKEVKYD